MIKQKAFTVIELLVVIVVIAVLATILVVAYSGLVVKSNTASLQSDLTINAKRLKMYYSQYGSYPTTMNGSYCPTAPSTPTDSSYCLIKSGNNIISSYTGAATTFNLKMQNGTLSYQVTESSTPTVVASFAGPYVVTSKFKYNNTGSTISFNAADFPGIQNGDMLIAFELGSDQFYQFDTGSAAITIPAGWTTYAYQNSTMMWNSDSSASAGITTGTWSGNSLSFGPGGQDYSNGIAAGVVVVRGATAVDAYALAPDFSPTSLTRALPSVTTTGTNRLLLSAIWSTMYGGTNTSLQSFSGGSTILLKDQSNGYSTPYIAYWLSIGQQNQSSAGLSASTSAVFGIACAGFVTTVAIK